MFNPNYAAYGLPSHFGLSAPYQMEVGAAFFLSLVRRATTVNFCTTVNNRELLYNNYEDDIIADYHTANRIQIGIQTLFWSWNVHISVQGIDQCM
jgi:hypothetical protein